ncbi:hypothetical protein [Salinibaculum salinum]|uniref:hypothetical protein n=1 Tax=Salinibaculum salinum TaxID=3131996 RepID=UPI0030EBB06A
MTGNTRNSSDGALLEALAETEWADVPTDPDLRRNLDYKLRDWEVLRPSDESDQVVFLPEDEELLRSEAFVIAEQDGLCSLEQRR